MSGGRMSNINISNMCIVSDIAITEYNQVELSKLGAGTTNSV